MDGDQVNKLTQSCHLSPLSERSVGEVPVVGPIWRGGIEIRGKVSKKLDGLEVFMPKILNPKVDELKRRLQKSVCFRMKSRRALWPKHFDDVGAAHSDIELFMLLEVSRSEVDYGDLVEQMISNDLAMTSHIGNFKLIIFTSLELEDNQQYKQGKYYLWGILKGKGLKRCKSSKGRNTNAETLDCAKKSNSPSSAPSVGHLPITTTQSAVRYDFVPSLNQECKRPRSKRGRISRMLKEVGDVHKSVVADFPGKERIDKETYGGVPVQWQQTLGKSWQAKICTNIGHVQVANDPDITVMKKKPFMVTDEEDDLSKKDDVTSVVAEEVTLNAETKEAEQRSWDSNMEIDEPSDSSAINVKKTEVVLRDWDSDMEIDEPSDSSPINVKGTEVELRTWDSDMKIDEPIDEVVKDDVELQVQSNVSQAMGAEIKACLTPFLKSEELLVQEVPNPAIDVTRASLFDKNPERILCHTVNVTNQKNSENVILRLNEDSTSDGHCLLGARVDQLECQASDPLPQMEVNTMEIQRKRLRSEKNRLRKRKKVCYVCGDRGFYKLLVTCSECFDLSVHWYCLGIVPGINVFNWVCVTCSALTESEPSETALVEDWPEVLQKLPPKALPEILEEEQQRNQFQHSEETFVPMTVSYKEVVLSPFIEHPEEISQGLVFIVSPSGEITIQESPEPVFSHIGELVYKDEENEEKHSVEDIIQLPEAISKELVLLVTPSGKITIHESGKLDFSYAAELAYKDEIGEGYSIEDTVELDFGAEEQIDSGFLNETVELDFGTDEENDVCYPHEPPTIRDFLGEDLVHQGFKASKVNVGIQPVSTNIQSERLSLPVPKHSVQPRLSENESQSSKLHDSREMSTSASLLDMANGFIETRIDVGPYKIRSDLAPILRNLLSKYGDIFHDCVVAPDIFLVRSCEVVQYLNAIPFKSLRRQHIDYIRDTLKVLDSLAVNVEWLKKHCDYLEEVIHQTVKYLALKKECDETARNIHLKKKSAGSSVEEAHLRKLEDNMKSIKSLWKRISGKSSDDGLFNN